VASTDAVFFDVDFTLIQPGPKFQGSGYQASCARYGMTVDAALFDRAVTGAAAILDAPGHRYDDELFVAYTRRIIELMGGRPPAADLVARELYAEWAEHRHFTLYDDVRESFETLANRNIKIGLISNSHRCLESFQSHFELDGLIAVTVSSPELGVMKPHPRIFETALGRVQVPASAAAMVGDSLTHDVYGARSVGMRGILLARQGVPPAVLDETVPVISTLRALVDVLD
jgi:putative hydrolase of the HAD superfamily